MGLTSHLLQGGQLLLLAAAVILLALTLRQLRLMQNDSVQRFREATADIEAGYKSLAVPSTGAREN